MFSDFLSIMKKKIEKRRYSSSDGYDSGDSLGTDEEHGESHEKKTVDEETLRDRSNFTSMLVQFPSSHTILF